MRVSNINKESDSVTSFILAPIDGQPLPLCQAGQFVVLRLLADPGKPPVLRSYSLSDLPATDHFRISVKSELNGIGSSFLCNRVREGDVLDVSAPRGNFTLRSSQCPVVLVSAGVGATPMMSMLQTLAAEGSQREVWWIYGARNRIDHPFAEESRELLKQISRGRRYIVYSRPTATDQVGTDFDVPRHIDTPLLERIGVSQGSDFYLCGPSPFLQNMRDGLQNWGVLGGNVHTEIFGSLEAITPGMAQVDHTPHLPQGTPGSGPPVSFARSGITVAWDPKFASLLELAEACDVPVRWSCRTGVCHTCMTGLIAGSLRETGGVQIMRSNYCAWTHFPDYELPDHTGKLCKLSERQGDDSPVLTLARGHHCPKEHQQHLELAAFRRSQSRRLTSPRSPPTITILFRNFVRQSERCGPFRCNGRGQHSTWTKSWHLGKLGAYASMVRMTPPRMTGLSAWPDTRHEPPFVAMCLRICEPLADSAETVASFIYFFATWLNRHNSDRSRSCIAMTSPSGIHPGTRVSPRLSNETAVNLRHPQSRVSSRNRALSPHSAE